MQLKGATRHGGQAARDDDQGTEDGKQNKNPVPQPAEQGIVKQPSMAVYLYTVGAAASISLFTPSAYFLKLLINNPARCLAFSS